MVRAPRAPTRPPRTIGKYLLFDELASGGMATIYLGRQVSPAGADPSSSASARCVAIKRMHPQFSREPEFVAMFLDEARLAARVRHPNVVPTIDVERVSGEIVHVMPYVHGESLSHLVRAVQARGERVPLGIASAIMIDALEGLHAAHEATGDDGRPLEIVHRDVSPQNILVGTDGVARVLDFGVAKAAGRLHSTRGSEVKGKFAYMSPEQVQRSALDRRTDVWAATVVLWELVTGERLFSADNPAGSVQMILEAPLKKPSDVRADLPPDVDAIVSQGLERDANHRFASTRAIASALASALPPATRAEVGAWVERIAAEELFVRATRVRVIEQGGALTPGADADAPRGSMEPTAPGRGRVGAEPAPARAVTPPSTMASVTMTDDAPPVIPRSRPIVLVATLALVVLVGGALAIAIASRTDGANASEGAASVSASASQSAPTPTAAASASASTTTAIGAPSVTTSASANAATSSAATTSPTSSARASRATPTATAPRPNCSPPFRFDKDGTKIPKPECL